MNATSTLYQTDSAVGVRLKISQPLIVRCWNSEKQMFRRQCSPSLER